MAGPYLSWPCSTADCQLRLSVLYGTMQVHYVMCQPTTNTTNVTYSLGATAPLHQQTSIRLYSVLQGCTAPQMLQRGTY